MRRLEFLLSPIGYIISVGIMDKLSKFSILALFISSQNLFFLSTLKTENNSAAFGRHTSYHSSLQSKYIHFSRNITGKVPSYKSNCADREL